MTKLRRCPSSTALARFVDGAATAASKRRISEHVRVCPDCRAVVEAMKEIVESGDGILKELGDLDARSPEVRARLRILARRELRVLQGERRLALGPVPLRLAVTSLMAVIAFAAAFAVLTVLRSGKTPTIERDVNGNAISLIGPQGDVGGGLLAFSWTAAPGVHEYRLEIYDRGLERVYVSPPLSGMSFTLSAGASSPLSKRTPYFWKIVAASAEGKRVESEFGKFVVAK